jgi:hypothetical protein
MSASRSSSPTSRSAAAIVGGLVAALLAAVLALVINLGILGAIGAPEGPGTLGAGSAGVALSSPAPGQSPAPWASPPRGRPAPTTPGTLDREGHHRFGAGNDD